MLRYKEIKIKLTEMLSIMHEGDKLPSRPKLCQQLDTTRATLNKAIVELVEEGLLTTANGSGTYVSPALGRSKENEGNWGVIVPNIMDAIYPGLVRGVENVAQRYGVSIALCNSDNNAEKQGHYIQRLIHSGVSGFIMVPVIQPKIQESYCLYESLMKTHIPFVFCNRSVVGVRAPVVTSNDFYGGYIGTKHLIEKGYRKIAFISKTKYTTSENRCHGYLTAIMESNLEIDRKKIILEEPASSDGSEPAGYCSMKSLLASYDDLDAVFCFNDSVAVGVYKAIQEAGKRIPEDIGVIGYDNTLQICEQLSPRLSSLSYKNMEIGQTAAEILWKQINHQPISEFDYYLMQPIIVERESSKGKTGIG